MKRRPCIAVKEEEVQEEIPDQAGVKAIEDLLGISRRANKYEVLKISKKETTSTRTMVGAIIVVRKDIMHEIAGSRTRSQ